jgi:hypothetical protein
VVIQVSHTPVLCFAGALNALAQCFFIGIEHDVEHGETGVMQAGEYLLQVRAGQDRLRSNDMLTGVASQFAAVATTSGRHGGHCWKSDTGWSARFGCSIYPTVSGSNTRLRGIRERSSMAVEVLPQPKVPLSQTITWSWYERTHSRSQVEVRRVGRPVGVRKQTDATGWFTITAAALTGYRSEADHRPRPALRGGGRT